MNVKIDYNYTKSFHPVFKQDIKEQTSPQTSIEKAEQKDFFQRNKFVLGAAAALAIGGIIYAASRGRLKSDKPQTHIERLNCFGKQIIEDMRFDDNGKLLQKQIEHEGIKYTANYSAGKLTDIEGYMPRKSEEFKDEKYSVLRGIIDELESELVVSRKFDDKTKYWLFDKKGETVTQVDEIKVENDFLYQYGNCRINTEHSFAYQIEDTYSPKDNIPFGEIFECFKKGLI
jgi:hypothetical protein